LPRTLELQRRFYNDLAEARQRRISGNMTATALSRLMTDCGVSALCPVNRLAYFDISRDAVIDMMHTSHDNTQRVLDLLRGTRSLDYTNADMMNELERESVLTFVKQTLPFDVSSSHRVSADERLASQPRVPSLLPWTVRAPLTQAAGRMRMHDSLLYLAHWAPLHLSSLLTPEPRRILIQFFTLLKRLNAREVRLSRINDLRTAAAVALSELELVFPLTEFPITMHLVLHIPNQLQWFGPSNNTWMFMFERLLFRFEILLTTSHSFFGSAKRLIHQRKAPETHLMLAVAVYLFACLLVCVDDD
jgi:hypothetical protein